MCPLCGSGSLRKVCQRTDKFLLLTEKFRKIVAKGSGKCYDNRGHIFAKIVHTYSIVYRDNAQRSVMGSCQFEEFRQRDSFLFYRACRLLWHTRALDLGKTGERLWE